jgi:GNAT superfamily N-acetyltransferase
MISVLHLRKELDHLPAKLSVAGVGIRSLVVPGDIDAWLALRERATAELNPAVRQWSRDDFLAEMVHQTWWHEAWTWLAVDERQVAGDLRVAGPARRSSPAIFEHEHGAQLIGAVTLAVRKGIQMRMPVIHWLLVDPAWRRCGVGRMLISHLERAAWDAGWREVQLETHAGWSEAVAFYQSIGYAPLPRVRSPR